MSTKAELLAGLRIRINDLTGTRWNDNELLAYLDDAARDYSKYFPRKREMQFSTIVGTQRYDVPDDLIDDYVLDFTFVDPVTLIQEIVPEKQQRRRGSTRFYEIVDQTIILGFVPYSNFNVLVRYNALHQMPDSGETSIPSEDEDLIYAYCAAAAWQRIGGNDAGLSRWTEGEKRDDSPIIPHYVRLWDRYNRLVQQKLSVPRTYKLTRVVGKWRDY